MKKILTSVVSLMLFSSISYGVQSTPNQQEVASEIHFFDEAFTNIRRAQEGAATDYEEAIAALTRAQEHYNSLRNVAHDTSFQGEEACQHQVLVGHAKEAFDKARQNKIEAGREVERLVYIKAILEHLESISTQDKDLLSEAQSLFSMIQSIKGEHARMLPSLGGMLESVNNKMATERERALALLKETKETVTRVKEASTAAQQVSRPRLSSLDEQAGKVLRVDEKKALPSQKGSSTLKRNVVTGLGIIGVLILLESLRDDSHVRRGVRKMWIKTKRLWKQLEALWRDKKTEKEVSLKLTW